MYIQGLTSTKQIIPVITVAVTVNKKNSHNPLLYIE
jgi:hypothetical protein